MPFQSLREFLQTVEEHGDLLRIEGADREEEIGALAEIVASTAKHPMLLFDKIKGYPSGYRVSASTMGRIRRMALGLGLDPALDNISLVKAWKEKLQTFNPIESTIVADGPVHENCFSGKQVDLQKFPAPKWHERDSGYYIGSG